MKADGIRTEVETPDKVEQRSATKLLQAVIMKTGLELVLICVAVSLAAFSHINPPLRGAIDVADATRVAGWAYDPREPTARLEVQLFVDGRFIAAGRADEPRADLVRRGAAEDALHGFTFAVPPLGLAPGRHTLQVFAVHSGSANNKTLLSLTRSTLTLHINAK
jgi:hypothetical protein